MTEHHSISTLLPIATHALGAERIQTVDARNLHAFLGLTKDYSDWIKAQIKRLHLVENRDYIVFPPKGERENQWVTAIEYHITFDAPKHIAMASSAKKGHEVREFFIAKEKELSALHAGEARPMLTHAQMFLEQAKINAEMEHKLLALQGHIDEFKADVADLKAGRPPEGKTTAADWLRATGKPRLKRERFESFKVHARQLEQAEPWTAPGRTYPEYFYTPATLDTAYRLAMRQLILFSTDKDGNSVTRDASAAYRRRGRGTTSGR